MSVWGAFFSRLLGGSLLGQGLAWKPGSQPALEGGLASLVIVAAGVVVDVKPRDFI